MDAIDVAGGASRLFDDVSAVDPDIGSRQCTHTPFALGAAP